MCACEQKPCSVAVYHPCTFILLPSVKLHMYICLSWFYIYFSYLLIDFCFGIMYVFALNSMSLMIQVLKHLEREKIELKDGNMLELLLLSDKISEMISGINDGVEQYECVIKSETHGRNRGSENCKLLKIGDSTDDHT